MSDQEFFIGKSDFNKKTFTKTTWFKLEIGDNFYRILPPLFSMAKTGAYKVFYAIHGGFKTKKGWQVKFQCVEEKDFKNNIISQRCPVCDLVNEYKKQYDSLAASGNATKEQLSAFHAKFIMPFQVDKKYYVNAINASGEIGLLPLPYKLSMSLETLLKAEGDKGKDPTGIEGAFLKFVKQSRFKGDNQVNYFVDLATEVDGDVVRIKRHSLTQDIINQIKQKARDLGTLYRTFDPDQVATLVNADEATRVSLLDSYIGTGEKSESDDEDNTLRPTADGSTLARTVPGTDALLVSRPELNSQGFQPNIPQMPVVAQQPPVPQGYAAAPTPQPVPQPAPTPQSIQVTQGQPVNSGTKMSDADFMKQFMGKP